MFLRIFSIGPMFRRVRGGGGVGEFTLRFGSEKNRFGGFGVLEGGGVPGKVSEFTLPSAQRPFSGLGMQAMF